ncbi:MAG: outer membrane protein assembly factor BamB family protein [Acidimicrobiales bacterium]
MRRLAAAVAGLLVVAASACSSTAANPARTPAGVPTGVIDGWPTYHRTNDRNGVAPRAPNPSTLAKHWQTNLDGAVYGQPLTIGNAVLAATENDTVYSLAAATGKVLWRAHLGTPVRLSDLQCGNIDPLGITGTPAYDQRTGSLFVVTESTGGSHDLVALDATTGAVRFRRNLDVVGHDRRAEQQRGALAVAHGLVYVPFGGLYGDCGDYVGYLGGVRTDGSGAVERYVVPTSREGGIWAASGPAVGPDGSVYVSVGNGAATAAPYDGSDAVLRLSPDLTTRLGYFAPTAWAHHNATDTDLGSTGPLLLPGGLVALAGKDGTVYLLDATHLGGIGGQLAALGGCTGFGGLAARGAANGEELFVPCAEGLLQVRVRGRTLQAGWRAPALITGSPVVGGGAVWALDTDLGVLYALDASSGQQVARVLTGSVTHFTTPVVAGSLVLVGTKTGVVAIGDS